MSGKADPGKLAILSNELLFDAIPLASCFSRSISNGATINGVGFLESPLARGTVDIGFFFGSESPEELATRPECILRSC